MTAKLTDLQPYAAHLPDPGGYRDVDGDWVQHGYTEAAVRSILADAHAHYENAIGKPDGVYEQRLINAIEGVCEGLSIDVGVARKILQHVRTGLPQDAQINIDATALPPAVETFMHVAPDPAAGLAACVTCGAPIEARNGNVGVATPTAPDAARNAETIARMLAQPAGDAACPVVAYGYENTRPTERAPLMAVQLSNAGDQYPELATELIRRRDHLAAMAAKDARIAELEARALAAEAKINAPEPRHAEALVSEHMQLVDAAMRARLTAHTERQAHLARNEVEASARKLLGIA